MSAIVGFLGLDGRAASESDLGRMIESLAHRGPDGRRVWLEDGVGLGHCMLHTTPESLSEHLPLRREHLTITADARLDNRADLLRILRGGSGTDSISDSELILDAYLRWGEDCPQRLLGDFAFAIWDASRRDSLRPRSLRRETVLLLPPSRATLRLRNRDQGDIHVRTFPGG